MKWRLAALLNRIRKETMTTIIKGIDYAFDPPKISSLAPAGIKFAVRYTSPGVNPKNLTKAELSALLAAGLHVALVFESTAGRMRAGHDAGVADAGVADSACKALSMPGLPVYFAADWDVQPGELAACDAYLDGVASVITRSRTGVYGGLRIVKHALDNHKAAYAWQTYAWSGGVWDARAQLRQVKNGVALAGGTVDLDEAHAADYGQWPRPVIHHGPYRHVVPAGNTLSIDAVARARPATVDHLADVTRANTDPLHLAIFDAYMGLRSALKAAQLPSPVLPEGLVYWTSNP